MLEHPNRCPHCSSSPIINCVTHPDDHEEWTIQCSCCKAGPSSIFPTKDEAKSAWHEYQNQQLTQ